VQITVVGAGVIGLTTALTLEEQGHEVRIVAAASGRATTSDVAGAIWFPYKCGPPHKVGAWALRTRAWLEQLAADPDTGIDILTGYEITTDAEYPWWAEGPPGERGREERQATPERIIVERAPAPVAGAPPAWRFTAPRVEPARFLPWLTARLRAPIDLRIITDLAAEPGDAVVNCTGLGAAALTGDTTVTGLRGQIALALPGGFDRRVTITDDRDPEAVFYVIPRRDELVLGGCTIPSTSTAIEPDITARILRQARALGLPIGEVRVERVGLRPFRPEVRLERDPEDPRIIHNYGHGGAGFTLCRGCAEDVAAIAIRT
jgi:D-amino-acid oxidase